MADEIAVKGSESLDIMDVHRFILEETEKIVKGRKQPIKESEVMLIVNELLMRAVKFNSGQALAKVEDPQALLELFQSVLGNMHELFQKMQNGDKISMNEILKGSGK